MATPEKEVAYLEGKVDEHSQALAAIRDSIGRLEHRIDARFDGVDRRFEGVDRRFEAIDRRFDTIERRFDVLDGKVSQHFLWMVGIQVTTPVAIVGALLSRG